MLLVRETEKGYRYCAVCAVPIAKPETQQWWKYNQRRFCSSSCVTVEKRAKRFLVGTLAVGAQVDECGKCGASQCHLYTDKEPMVSSIVCLVCGWRRFADQLGKPQ